MMAPPRSGAQPLPRPRPLVPGRAACGALLPAEHRPRTQSVFCYLPDQIARLVQDSDARLCDAAKGSVAEQGRRS